MKKIVFLILALAAPLTTFSLFAEEAQSTEDGKGKKDEMDVNMHAEEFTTKAAKIASFYRPELIQMWTCGDSISAGYGRNLREKLEGKVSYVHSRSLEHIFPEIDLPRFNGVSSTLIDIMEVVLPYEKYQPDFMVLNAGLHDAFRGPGKGQGKIPYYEQSLKKIISLAKQYEVPVIWIQTTSKVAGDPLNDLVDPFNELSRRLMEEAGYPVIDLDAFNKELVSEIGEDEVYMKDGLHFAFATREKQGDFIAEQLLELMADEIAAKAEANADLEGEGSDDQEEKSDEGEEAGAVKGAAKDEMDVNMHADELMEESAQTADGSQDHLLQMWTCGDSISSGYGKYLRPLLDGKIHYMHLRQVPERFPEFEAPRYNGLAFTLINGLKAVLEFEGYQPDFLLLNSGLHDAFRGKGEGEEKIAYYRESLQTIISLAQAHHIPLIWVQTTSKVEGDSLNLIVDRFNEVSKEVMAEAGYAVIDLDAFTKGLVKEEGEEQVYLPDGLHFSYMAREKQAEFIAAQLIELMAEEIEAKAAMDGAKEDA